MKLTRHLQTMDVTANEEKLIFQNKIPNKIIAQNERRINKGIF